MQCACAILSSVACPALQYFSTLSHKRHDFRQKVTEHKMWVLVLCTTFVWNISYSEKNLAECDHKCVSVCCMYSAGCYSCQVVMQLGFSRQIFKKIRKYKISWESVQWERSCSMWTAGRTDGRTDGRQTRHDMTKLTLTYRNFANAPQNCIIKRFMICAVRVT